MENGMVSVGDRGVQFTDLEGMFRFAKMVAASGMAPRNMQKPEQICVALQMGYEIGLTPMQSLQNIAVINGRPSIYGDATIALVHGSNLAEDWREYFEELDEEGNLTDKSVAVCTSKRRGVKTPFEYRFSVSDAKLSKLWGKSGPWRDYPKRMLQLRARGFLIRDAYADALHGLITAEEAMDYPVNIGSIPNDPGSIAKIVESSESIVSSDDINKRQDPPKKDQPEPPEADAFLLKSDPPKAKRGRPKKTVPSIETDDTPF